MNGPVRKEWWATRASGYGEGRGKHGSRNMFQWQNQRQMFFDETSSLASDDCHLARALLSMAAQGNSTACGVLAMPHEERKKFFLHVRLTKHRTPFIDKLLATALALRMGARDGDGR